MGYEATIKELGKNLIGKNVTDMLPDKSITNNMMKISPAYLMLLKEKICGTVKARGCANGNKNKLLSWSQVHLT